ncbi:hypothetical protein [Spirosoma luteum]|uniref:hypothetical protein n=1 Tax=Spirosoma luteum TaxID=431553 RepID=UPI0012FBF0A4|nr:hypothetical protein [Spirosoma luteum]
MKPTINPAEDSAEKYEAAFRRGAYTRTEMKALEQELINRKSACLALPGVMVEKDKPDEKKDKKRSTPGA